MTPALRGALWAIAAAAFHSLVPLAVRLLSDSLPPVEIVFLRNLIGLGALGAYFAWRGFGALKTRRIAIHAQRNVLNFAGMWLWFAALGVMPLGQAVALHFTVPLMAVVLAVIFLRERPGALRWTATFIGFGGVLIILRPGTIEIGPAAMLVLGSAISYAGVGIYTRVLGRTDDAAVTTFYYLLMLTVFAGNIGSEQRMEYTVIGDAVNVASRLCSKAAGGQVIVSEPFYKALKNPPEVESLEPLELKGKSDTVPVYQVKL